MTNLEKLQESPSGRFKEIIGFLLNNKCANIRCCSCPFSTTQCPDMDFASWCDEKVNVEASIWEKDFNADKYSMDHYYR